MHFGSRYVYAESEEEDEKEEVSVKIEGENGLQLESHNSQCGDSQTKALQKELSSGLPVPHVHCRPAIERADLSVATAAVAATKCEEAEHSAVLESKAAYDSDLAGQPAALTDAADCDHAERSQTSTAAAECSHTEPSMVLAEAAADSIRAERCAALAAAAACDREGCSASIVGVADSNNTNLSAGVASTCAVDGREMFASSAAAKCNRSKFSYTLRPSSNSDSSQNAASGRAHNAVGVARSSVPSSRSTASGRPKKEANTNVVCIQFHQLVSPVNMHTGEPVRCTNCSVILSHQSRVAELPDGGNVWQCEFCDYRNEVDIHPEEQPKTKDVTYMIAPPPQMSAYPNQPSDIMIVFCVDFSGSMSVTTEVPGRLILKGRQVLNTYQRFLEYGDGDQTLPNASRGVTNVTRLESVQIAIEQKLSDLARDSPNSRAAIIAFNDTVTYLGDGSCEPVTIGEHNLCNRELLVRAGESAPLPGPVRDSHSNLSSKLFQLEECGRTALGPALVMAIALAGRARVSKVVLCTDGLANVGLGNMEAETNGADLEAKSQHLGNFYEDIGRVAAEKGVTVSILTIKGTTCNLAQLSAIAQHTSGEVKTVDPLKLHEEFANVVQDDILATNATATFLVHKSLYIEGEDGEPMIKRVDHGNVRENSEITFKFGVKKQYRHVLREQLRSSTAAPPDEKATAAAAAASADKDRDRMDSSNDSQHSDDDGMNMSAMETESPRNSGAPQETHVANQAALAAWEECTTALLATKDGSYVLANDATLLAQSQSSLPSTGVSMEGVQSAATGALSSSALAGMVQEAPEAAASSRCDPSTNPVVDSSSYNGSKSECRTNTSTATQQDVCFQIQVEYTDRAGGRALRVLTAKRPLTADRFLTERTMDPSVICAHTWRGAGKAFLSSKGSDGMDILTSGEHLISRSGRHRSISERFSASVRSAKEFSSGQLSDEASSNMYRCMTRSSKDYSRDKMRTLRR